MATRVLIINKQLVFAVTIKQALEQTGVFDVHPFTAADAALDYLQDHPQDVALIDLTLPGINGAELVQRLRAVQPDLAIIGSPRQSDATSVMRSLRLQGLINTPFSVRDIVPLIEHAIEDAQEGLLADVDDQTTQSDVLKPLRPMQARALDDAIAEEPVTGQPEVGKTRILDDEIFELPENITRMLDEEPSEPPPGQVFGKTRILDDELPDPPSSQEFGKTRILDDDAPPESGSGETRIFDDEAADQTANIPGQTRMLGDDAPESGVETPLYGRPGSVPEISNLESVLANLADSSLFEPAVTEEDTPAVSTKDSEALRQFLATSGQVGDAGFDDVLEAIEPDQTPSTKRDRDMFSDLVESMRSSEPQTTLPDRQQQFMDFILTSGMDNVLQEIEKVKTGTLRQLDEPPSAEDSSRTFQRLAEEEPPMPTLEESGTIGDLMIGVSDKSFRNVLAVLRGEEEVEESEVSRPRTLSQQEMEEAFAAFYDPVKGVEPLPEEQPPARPARLPEARREEFQFGEPPIEEEPGDSTLAQIILETALDESTPLGSSLSEVMTNIESRLSVYRPDIKPLPSWGPAFERRKREEERLIREPDFLPEELPPPVDLSAVLPELEHTDRFNIETTKPSSRQVIEAHPEDIDTDQYERSPMSSQVAEDTPTSRPEWVEREEGEDFTPLPADYAEEVVEPEVTEFEAEVSEQPEPGAESPVEQWPVEEVWPSEEAEAEVLEESVPEEVWPEEPAAGSPPETVEEEAWPEAAPQAESEFAEVWPDEAEIESWPEAEPAAVTEAAPEAGVSEDDALVAQLALNLTQASLELTAEATLLTRDGEMVASAGHLASEDIEELSSIIAHDWEAYPEGARIRFVTLASSGKDYMLYSLKTDEGFTLSLIFAGTTPLRVIRRQGQRLATALQAVPEAPVEEAPTPEETLAEPEVAEEAQAHVEIEKPVEAGVLTAYAFVWLLRDPDMHLVESATQAIHAGLSIQLAEQGWRIKNLQVAEDYIYLLADVPGERAAQHVMRELQHRSAEIAHAQDASLDPASLWADSYFILTPGRELDMDEIMGFINFERMT